MSQLIERASEIITSRERVRAFGVLGALIEEDAPIREPVIRDGLARTIGDHAMVGDATTLTISIADDGAGTGDVRPRSGLVNLRNRAEARGGSFTLEAGNEKGLRWPWTSPIG